MSNLVFTLPEIVCLIGLAQCVYLIVYILFRAGRLSRAGLPLLYFFVLGLAFLADFGQSHLEQSISYYNIVQWAAWFTGPPLSVLMILQIAQITRSPSLRNYWILLLIPVAFEISWFFAGTPEDFHIWLVITGIIAGTMSLLAIWGQSHLLDSVQGEYGGKERYWLILALIFMNVFFLIVMIFSLNPEISNQTIMLARNVLGLSFIYLVSTSLLRIYPQAVRLSDAPERNEVLSAEDHKLIEKIEKLLTADKVYHESNYSRSDLARECNAPEATISRVINLHFQKSFPQLMNEYRVEDAKRLLLETGAPIKTICEEVGFNSLPSFNRVFKDITGEAPSSFRKEKKAPQSSS